MRHWAFGLCAIRALREKKTWLWRIEKISANRPICHSLHTSLWGSSYWELVLKTLKERAPRSAPPLRRNIKHHMASTWNIYLIPQRRECRNELMQKQKEKGDLQHIKYRKNILYNYLLHNCRCNKWNLKEAKADKWLCLEIYFCEPCRVKYTM